MKIHHNETFDCYEVTECDCKFGKDITLDGELLIPLSEIIKLRDKIQKIHDDTDAKAKAEEPYRGFNEKADLACFLYRNDIINPLNEIIKYYSEEKELNHDNFER